MEDMNPSVSIVTTTGHVDHPEFSVLLVQFFCKFKTVIEIKFILKN